MKIPRRFLRIFAVVGLVPALTATNSFAQSAAAPPMVPSTPSGAPQQSPSGPSSKVVPTGLEANGGSFSGGVYRNSIFGFSLQIPPGWPVVPTSAAQPGNPEPGQSPLPEAHQVTRVLLLVTENAPLKKSYQRKSIQILAMRLSKPPGPDAAAGYLAYSQKTAKERGTPVEYLGDPAEVTINGRKLWKVAFNETTSGAILHAEQYVTIEEGTVLQFFLLSPDEAGVKELEPWIQSLRFEAAKARPTKRQAAKKK